MPTSSRQNQKPRCRLENSMAEFRSVKNLPQNWYTSWTWTRMKLIWRRVITKSLRLCLPSTNRLLETILLYIPSSRKLIICSPSKRSVINHSLAIACSGPVSQTLMKEASLRNLPGRWVRRRPITKQAKSLWVPSTQDQKSSRASRVFRLRKGPIRTTWSTWWARF